MNFFFWNRFVTVFFNYEIFGRKLSTQTGLDMWNTLKASSESAHLVSISHTSRADKFTSEIIRINLH